MAECKLKLLAVWRSSGEAGDGGGEVKQLSEDEEDYGATGGGLGEAGDDMAMGSGGFSDEADGEDGEKSDGEGKDE